MYVSEHDFYGTYVHMYSQEISILYMRTVCLLTLELLVCCADRSMLTGRPKKDGLSVSDSEAMTEE